MQCVYCEEKNVLSVVDLGCGICGNHFKAKTNTQYTHLIVLRVGGNDSTFTSLQIFIQAFFGFAVSNYGNKK